VARGLALRHDWGPQYRSGHFLGSIAWLGIADDAAFLGEPETNGCAERWIRTLEEQCLWVELHDTIDELRQAVARFTDRYNTSWLIQRHGHRTPRRPIRQHKRRQQHDQVGTTSVQETGRCSESPTSTDRSRSPTWSFAFQDWECQQEVAHPAGQISPHPSVCDRWWRSGWYGQPAWGLLLGGAGRAEPVGPATGLHDQGVEGQLVDDGGASRGR
jgi:Integrase core domain